MSLPDSAYARLLALRTGLRQFVRWSEQQAHAAGLTPAQHQLLLAIRGHGDARGPTIGEVADYLLLRHHSAVGLVDRAEAAGLVRRYRDHHDHRVVRLQLTSAGARRLERISASNLQELERLTPQLSGLWEGLEPVRGIHGFSTQTRRATKARASGRVNVARVYDDPREQPGQRVLVDRLWPRGLSRAAAEVDEWAKDVAPSSELRRWYGHVPDRFAEFAQRYRSELERGAAKEALEDLRARANSSDVVLVTATRDLGRSGAAVLKAVLAGS